MFVLDDILMSPVKLAVWLAEKIKEQADAEMNDVGKIKETLARLQEQFDAGQLSQQEFEKLEAKWLERLQKAQEFQKEKNDK